MPRLSRLDIMSANLPFRRAFRHAAAVRSDSESVFLKCVTDDGATGFGECLPRPYVTGETRDATFALLQESILPRLIGMSFASMDEVCQFLTECDGKAPSSWVDHRTPQSAAWCAVDLALLDAMGSAFGLPVCLAMPKHRNEIHCGGAIRYSAVVSAESSWRLAASLIKVRVYGFEQVKLKVGGSDVLAAARLARRAMGRASGLRVDANMAWDRNQALRLIRELDEVGIRCVEQPLDANDIAGMSTLVRETHAEIIADESFSDRSSLERLIDQRACTGVNVRISKCGGLIAAARRCEEALRAGLKVHIGCQVGESSLLSSAQLTLIAAVPEATCLEGCYGEHLLRADPVRPCLQFGYGGRLPPLPRGAGLAVCVDESALNQSVSARGTVAERSFQPKERRPCPSSPK